jgi:hypothetical protein
MMIAMMSWQHHQHGKTFLVAKAFVVNSAFVCCWFCFGMELPIDSFLDLQAKIASFARLNWQDDTIQSCSRRRREGRKQILALRDIQ